MSDARFSQTCTLKAHKPNHARIEESASSNGYSAAEPQIMRIINNFSRQSPASSPRMVTGNSNRQQQQQHHLKVEAPSSSNYLPASMVSPAVGSSQLDFHQAAARMDKPNMTYMRPRPATPNQACVRRPRSKLLKRN
jgi:hypothetical protein